MARTIGFIGLGNMGGRIAQRLRQAGYTVYGFDVRIGRAEQLGLEPATSVAEVCRQSETILLSLPDSTAVEQVVLGPDGIETAARSGTIVVDLTTADPDSTRRLHARLLERGVVLLDAAVSGGPAGAEAGTLTIMAGGPAEALERVRPVLEAFSSRIYPMGGPGNGHAAKVVNNFLNGINLAATAEAMVIGVKAGLDPAQLLEVINHSSGRNWATEHRFPRILEGDYLEGGLSNILMAKDLDLYTTLARRLGAATLLGPVCASVFGVAIGMGYGQRVSNTVVDVLGDLAGGVRVQKPSREAAATDTGA
ncbi:MAG TPA: NAD(P)-dependent oxidoreductase [Bacillota bacterium]